MLLTDSERSRAESDTTGSVKMEILFATGNSNKVSEASRVLAKFGHTISQLEIDGKTMVFSEPQADEIEEVAISKSMQARDFVVGTNFEEYAILVEDSGLFISSLNGFPGPYSSFVERKIGLQGILDLLENKDERVAEYRAVAILSTKNETFSYGGRCIGNISRNIIGGMGFGYDPIFIPDEGDGRTFGQLQPAEKSQISHRMRALKGLSETINLPSK